MDIDINSLLERANSGHHYYLIEAGCEAMKAEFRVAFTQHICGAFIGPRIETLFFLIAQAMHERDDFSSMTWQKVYETIKAKREQKEKDEVMDAQTVKDFRRVEKLTKEDYTAMGDAFCRGVSDAAAIGDSDLSDASASGDSDENETAN